MGWNSETFVARAPQTQVQAFWNFVHEAFEEDDDELEEPLKYVKFCCHFLQGRCRFSFGCNNSHEGDRSAEAIRRRGCSYGSACFLGHGAGCEPKLPSWDIEDRLKRGDLLQLTSQNSISHQGPNKSHEDPLWLEIHHAAKNCKVDRQGEVARVLRSLSHLKEKINVKRG
eukprot:gnl/MRDRNA2_/MRDRNA2_209507_c0_seq1.p1 gnl/MRDRNA2_/MRDRNA2_209507_c0~~gnl/MRDRNA2_/MRDRNA2_209507_c0_seq1.p1  ORF type:complete len:170 (+),score=29.14 gnl/MRDRNA2_/MRDRNA2_209507_c0_seq1:84-593(+)